MNLGEENETQEFKAGLGQLDEGLKALSAMLNRNGHGVVFYGVKDDGTISGITVNKKTLVDIRARIREKIEPQIMADIEDCVDECERHYVRVSANGYDKPYSFDGRYFLRTAASNERISTSLLRKMLVSGTTDLISEMESEDQNLTFNGFISFSNQKGRHARQSMEFFQSTGFLKADGKFNLTAFLMSDQNNLDLKVVRFSGADKTVMSERTEYGDQCLFYSLQQVFEYVTSFISTRVELAEGSRKETKLFDKESFREAWINACEHNAWSEKIAPAVYLFDDRVEIVSYGSIPYDLSVDGFYSGTSVPVNRGLFTLFSNMNFSEQTGHGIPTIVANYGREAFSFNDNMLKVTLKYAFEPESVMERKTRERKAARLTVNQQNIYRYLQQNPNATLYQAASSNGLSLAGTKKVVQKLKELDLLERMGSRRDGRWITK